MHTMMGKNYETDKTVVLCNKTIQIISNLSQTAQ